MKTDRNIAPQMLYIMQNGETKQYKIGIINEYTNHKVVLKNQREPKVSLKSI